MFLERIFGRGKAAQSDASNEAPPAPATTPETAKNSEKIGQKPLVLFFAGSNMEQHSNKPVGEMFQEFFSTEKNQDVDMTTFTSILSSEAMMSNRLSEMAAKIEEAMESGRDTTIMVYSLGASEFCTALLQMLGEREKKRKAEGRPFEPLNLDKIHLIIRSPAGMVRNLSDSWRQLRQFGEMLKSILTPGPHQQMDTLINFPPQHNGQRFLDQAWAALPQMFPNERKVAAFQELYGGSQNSAELKASNDRPQDFIQDKRFDGIRDSLQAVDDEFFAALQKEPKDLAELRAILAKRHKILQGVNAVGQVLDNKDNLLTGEDWKKKAIETQAQALLGLPRVLFNSFFGFGNTEVYRWLKSKGMRISLVVPDNEVFTPVDTLSEFFSLDDTDGGRKVKVDFAVSEAGVHTSMTGNTAHLRDALLAINA